MSQTDIGTFSEQSFNNRERVVSAEKCSCYSCGCEFKGSDVQTFANDGDTAICPNCQVDAVLPFVPSQEILASAKKYWFD